MRMMIIIDGDGSSQRGTVLRREGRFETTEKVGSQTQIP